MFNHLIMISQGMIPGSFLLEEKRLLAKIMLLLILKNNLLSNLKRVRDWILHLLEINQIGIKHSEVMAKTTNLLSWSETK